MATRLLRIVSQHLRPSDRLRQVRRFVRAHPREALITLGGLVVGAALVIAFVLAPSAGPLEPSPAAADPSGPDSASPSPPPSATAAAPTPDADDGTWGAIVLPPYEPEAHLVADATEGSRVLPAASFTLRSLGSSPATVLARRLTVEPTVELTVEAGTTASLATVRPAGPLIENAVYRFRLHDPDGALIDEWTFRTAGPLRVVRRLPEDRSTQVPLDTGIELEFDRDGVADLADHFSIDPPVDGAFERHGRTWVFVPASGLAASTLYTVTLRAGVRADGAADGLEQEVRLAFETAADRHPSDSPQVIFERPLYEVRPDEAGVIPVTVHGDFGMADSLERRATLFSLPTASAAIEAGAALAVDRSWARVSSNGNLDTAGLAEVGSFEVVVRTRWGEQRLELPTGLAAGFYLLDVAQDGRHAQLVLQVTDLAAYVLTSESRTIAWVNDLGSGAPIAGASATLRDGTRLGQTDASGLLSAPLSRALPDAGGPSDAFGRPVPELVLVTAADGAQVIAAVGPENAWFFGPRAGSERWWLVFGTDRLQYRSDDMIRAWGFVRLRADRSVPTGVELRLLAGWDPYAPPIARAPIVATPRGSILGDLPVEGLPPGPYSVALFIGDESVAQASVTVTEIRKPSLRIDVESERRAYVDGEAIAASARAAFFDGTGAPGLELRLGGDGVTPANERVVKLGADGAAAIAVTATSSYRGLTSGHISATPASPEEGQSFGQTTFALFPSSVWLTGDATLGAGTLTVSGRLTRVDLAAAAAEFAEDGWVTDPSGDALAGHSITATVDRITWRRVPAGTSYDFLEKGLVPSYSYEREAERIGTFRPVSGADGSFSLTLPFDPGEAGAEITLSAADEQRRTVELMTWASADPRASGGGWDFPYLEQRVFCGGRALMTAGVGEEVEINVRSGDGAPSAGGRTLFAISRAGIDDVIITSAAGIDTVLDDEDLPNLTVRAVRLTPAGYVVTNDVAVAVDPEDKTITLRLASDRPRYAPGDEVSVSVTTIGPDGGPIAADVIVQAVDARLYAIGAAQVPDPGGLMMPTSSGFAGSYATHRVPSPMGDGCGAATGGDPRDDFRDSATFQLIRTTADGRGRATFDVPDDLTSWVVSATAFSDALDAGSASFEVPVGLPLFVDAAIAPEYLAGEEPIVHLRAYGDGLRTGDAVTFTIESESLGLQPTSVPGRAFEQARVRLPALTLGDHALTISVAGPGELRDTVARTVRVVPTRLRTLQTAHSTVGDIFTPPGGDGMTTYVITDAGRGAVVPVLQQLAGSGSARLDASMAAELARQLLIESFGLAEASLPGSGYSGVGHQPEGGLALFPYASADLFLTARAAVTAPDQLSTSYVVTALTSALETDPSRERAIVALAGLAAVGQDVTGQLRAVDPDPLTVRERLWLALGLLAAGDADAARAIERATLTEHGQRLGDWVRLDAGIETPETAETTASMLLLAAQLRDPVALDISRYLLANPSREHLPALEQIGFARSAMEWLPRVQPRFSWRVDGDEHEETLEPGGSLVLRLTGRQRESFALTPLDGELFVASAWLGEARLEDLPRDASVRIERTVSPADHAPADDLVRVTLKVHVSEPLAGTCYQVTDLLPSGLAPVAQRGWTPDDPEVIAPYEVEGQRVSWCIGPDRTDVTLGYTARVVSPGTYRWEPAVVQAAAAPTVGSATAEFTYTID
jgi:alpha-2-macroglobulin